MTGNAKIGVALLGGYLLGRTKKAKMAIGFGMFLAGKKLSFDPKQLGKLMANSPVLGTLNDQVRKELVDATKSAATNALTQRAAGLADSLHQRTLDLDGKDAGAEEREDDEDRDEDDRDLRDDADEDEDDAGHADHEKPSPRRRPAAKQSAKAPSGRTGGTRKKASSATRKATSGARRTASSAARKERGDDNG